MGTSQKVKNRVQVLIVVVGSTWLLAGQCLGERRGEANRGESRFSQRRSQDREGVLAGRIHLAAWSKIQSISLLRAKRKWTNGRASQGDDRTFLWRGVPKTRLSLRGGQCGFAAERGLTATDCWWLPQRRWDKLDKQQADLSAQVAVQADVIAVRTTRLWRRICSYKSREGAQIVLALVECAPNKVCAAYVTGQ